MPPKADTAQPSDLATVIRFADPAECEMAEPLASAFASLLDQVSTKNRSGAISLPGWPRPLIVSIDTQPPPGSPPMRNATLPVKGRWNGLDIVGFRVSAPEASDFIAEQILFSAPADRARTILNRQGFDLPPVGKWRETRIGTETPGSIAIVELNGGRSALSCQ